MKPTAVHSTNTKSAVIPQPIEWQRIGNQINAAIGYASQYSRSHHAVIRVYDAASNVIKTHKHKGDFKEW